MASPLDDLSMRLRALRALAPPHPWLITQLDQLIDEVDELFSVLLRASRPVPERRGSAPGEFAVANDPRISDAARAEVSTASDELPPALGWFG